MPADPALASYYARRAPEYERIYQKPERQNDLAGLHDRLPRLFSRRHVLEVACGTGYWTKFVARTARAITATDITDEVLELARGKDYGACPVHFERLDAFRCASLAGPFDAGLAAFWWSHVRRGDWSAFLQEFHRALAPGSPVALLDNRFIPGSNTPIARTDDEGNTYQLRRLENGETHEVLKNFPGEEELLSVVDGIADDVTWTPLEYHWLLTYRTRPAPAALKLLFVCSMNLWRSPTAERVFEGMGGCVARSAGTEDGARVKITAGHIGWADIVFVMEPKHRRRLDSKFAGELRGKRLVCLNIPDTYRFMDPELVALLQSAVAEHLPPSP